MKTRLRPAHIIVPLVILVLGTLGALWFFENYEKKPYEAWQGASAAARNDAYLAARNYLRTLGREAFSKQGLTRLYTPPQTTDAIVLPRPPVIMSRRLTAKLYAWIEQGGHLLVAPRATTSHHPGASDLLKRIGVALDTENDEDCGCPSAKAVENNEEEEDGYHPYDTLIDRTIDGAAVNFEYFYSTLLKDVSENAVFRIDGTYRTVFQEEKDHQRKGHNRQTEQDGAWLLQYRIGRGRVTVMSDMWIFSNYNIGNYDHAFLLSWLVRDNSRIWFLNAMDRESLTAILWRNLPCFWTALAVLILLFLWHMQERSGTLLRPGLDTRRNILAHIDATGLYTWRMGKASAMIAENRKILLTLLARRQLGLHRDRPNKEASLTRLAAKTDISEQELLLAFKSSIANEQDLIRTSQTLQKIEKLNQGGKHDR